MTRKCLEYIKKYSDGLEVETIVVDNASKDGSADMVLEEFADVKVIKLSENRGFAGGNIPGMKMATGKYVLLLNSDAFIDKDSLKKAVSFMDKNNKTGILGCKLTNPDGSLQPSARMLPSPLNKFLIMTGLAHRFPESRFFGRVDFTWWDHSSPKKVGWVVGAFFMIRRETMEEIGYLDDRYFLYFEEIDYCLTARHAGWDVVFYPSTQVVHLGGQSAAKTGLQISNQGMQVISIRIESELKYYCKFYGFYYAFMAIGVEFLWNFAILSKNILIRFKKGADKRDKALKTMKLIIQALKK